MTSIQYYGTGRRKNATARVFLRPGGGEIKVNDRSLDEYFKRESLKLIIRQPLLLTETAEKFNVLVRIQGGGWQARPGPFDMVCPGPWWITTGSCDPSSRTLAF